MGMYARRYLEAAGKTVVTSRSRALPMSIIGLSIIALSMAVSMSACATTPTAGFWYHDDALRLSADANARLGELETNEAERIKQLSLAEIEQAFSGLIIVRTSNDRALWRVAVLRSLPTEGKHRLPEAGESLALGFLGGTGAVGVDVVAAEAIRYAAPNASRQSLIEGIGRGIGRVAVHEFMHQMLGAAAAHNDDDLNSYEYGSPERASQYYGDLHWSTAWPLLHRRFGTDTSP
jgi:hypothetical protein